MARKATERMVATSQFLIIASSIAELCAA